MASLAVITAILSGGWKLTLRFQNWGVAIAMGGLALVSLILLFKSRSGFEHSFNDSARAVTGGDGTYQSLIDKASKAGFAESGKSLGQTWPVVGIVLAFSMFSWWSIHIAGEVRRAATWQITGAMVLAVLLTMVILSVCTAIFFKTFGSEFFGAVNAINGTPDYPFGSPPYYTFLASLGTGSTFLSVIFGFAFTVGVFVVLYVQLVQPTRALFAYAMDGVMPRQVAQVSTRYRVPVVSHLLVLVISSGVLAWAIWGTSFFTVLAYAILFLLTAMTLLAVSAAILPYRRPELYRASAVQRSFLGIPVLTISALLGLAGLGLAWYLFLHYPELGIANPATSLRNVAIVAVAGMLIYAVAAVWRSRAGLSLGALGTEIPPE